MNLFAGICPIFLFLRLQKKTVVFRRGIWVSGRKRLVFNYSFYNFWIIYAVGILLLAFKERSRYNFNNISKGAQNCSSRRDLRDSWTVALNLKMRKLRFRKVSAKPELEFRAQGQRKLMNILTCSILILTVYLTDILFSL